MNLIGNLLENLFIKLRDLSRESVWLSINRIRFALRTLISPQMLSRIVNLYVLLCCLFLFDSRTFCKALNGDVSRKLVNCSWGLNDGIGISIEQSKKEDDLEKFRRRLENHLCEKKQNYRGKRGKKIHRPDGRIRLLKVQH